MDSKPQGPPALSQLKTLLAEHNDEITKSLEDFFKDKDAKCITNNLKHIISLNQEGKLDEGQIVQICKKSGPIADKSQDRNCKGGQSDKGEEAGGPSDSDLMKQALHRISNGGDINLRKGDISLNAILVLVKAFLSKHNPSGEDESIYVTWKLTNYTKVDSLIKAWKKARAPSEEDPIRVAFTLGGTMQVLLVKSPDLDLLRQKLLDVAKALSIIEDPLPSSDEVEDELKEAIGSYLMKSNSSHMADDSKIFNQHYIKDLVMDKDPGTVVYEDVDKSVVTVLAGESGSGKTVCAGITLPELNKASVIYISIDSNTIKEVEIAAKAKFKKDNPDDAEFPTPLATPPILSRLFSAIMGCISDKANYETKFFEGLAAASSRVNCDRNLWACLLTMQLIEKAVNNVSLTCALKQTESCAKRWWQASKEERAKSCCIDKLIFVFDEIGRDMNLVHGVISSSRILLRYLQKECYALQVGMVLCSPNLDRIKTLSNDEKYAGSDPSLSNVIAMARPNIDRLQDYPTFWPSKEAILGGTFSSVYCTNLRMLVKGIRPILMGPLAMFEPQRGCGKSVAERQAMLGSYQLVMEYSVRMYDFLNGMKDHASNASMLRKKAFQYMHSNALKSLKGPESAIKTAAKIANQYGDEIPNDHLIFQIGVATQDPAHTSTALKLVACGGIARPTYISDGISFEATISGHLYRMYQCLGYRVHEYNLKAGWPNPSNHVISDSDEVAMDADVKYIAKLLQGSNDKAAVILGQTCLNAQGADKLAISLEPDQNGAAKLKLEVIQGKNEKQVRKISALIEAAGSVGIGYDGKIVRDMLNKNAYTDQDKRPSAAKKKVQNHQKALEESSKKQELDFQVRKETTKKMIRAATLIETSRKMYYHPADMKHNYAAFYSKSAIDKLLEDLIVEMGLPPGTPRHINRIVALSNSAAELHEQPSEHQFEVWSREFFEPSISVFDKMKIPKDEAVTSNENDTAGGSQNRKRPADNADGKGPSKRQRGA